MSHWNYRVVQTDTEHGSDFTIREVYYDDENVITMWSSTPSFPVGETVAELRVDMELMAQALERPVLNAKDLPS